MISTFDIGALARLTGTYTDINGALVDPTTASVSVKAPDGTVTTATPSKDSTGIYHYDFQTTLWGNHFYRFTGTGAAVGAGDSQFLVKQSPVLS